MGKNIEDIITDLLSRERLSAEEREMLDEWMKNPGNRKLFSELQKIGAAVNASKKASQIDVKKSWKQFNQKFIPQKKLTRFLPYAAAMVIVGFGLTMLILKNERAVSDQASAIISPVVTGQKQAILTLSTGQQIVLSESLSPMIEANGTTIQSRDNQLVYNPTDTTSIPVYNTVTVPRGGEYKLVLADNTTVWLNSESQLTYPVVFKGNTRELELEGEAFFEVTKDKHKPFIVHTSQFNIRVTGTQFNIRTYPEETESATLAEGSIQLEKDHRVYQLVPGQQAYLHGEEVKVKEVNLEDAIAWRYNTFSFKEVPLDHIMNELSRWYDINIFYLNPEIKKLHFTAWFRRSTPIQELLKILEKTQQVKLELKGKTLIVAKQS